MAARMKMAADAGKLEDLRKRVNRIRLLTLRLADEQLSGEYHSSFKGQGIEFDEVRPYVPGDDVRAIDWNVTARTGAPHVKRYSEERELTVIFLVDVSGSQGCGSAARTKSELAALAASLLALAATENGDNVGLVDFTDRIVKYVPPRRGRTAVMRLVREILADEGAGAGRTAIGDVLKRFGSLQKRRALVFLISDFLDTGFSHELRVAARRHDLVAISISDPAERALPDAGLIEVADPESGEIFLLDSSLPTVRRRFGEAAADARAALARAFESSGIDEVALSTGDSDDEVVAKLRRLFLLRAKRGAGR